MMDGEDSSNVDVVGDADYGGGIAVGAFITTSKYIQQIKQVLKSQGWLKVGINVTPFTPPQPQAIQHDFAVHANSEGALCLRRYTQKSRHSLSDGEQLPLHATSSSTSSSTSSPSLPSALANLIAIGSTVWIPGLRVYCAVCQTRHNVSKHPSASDKSTTSNTTTNHASTTKFKFSELFCGIGGFRVALEHLGGEAVFASELDHEARHTYRDNFINGDQITGDISEIEAHDIADHDVLTAGFPCQTFSRAGEMKGFGDQRGMLYLEIVRVLKHKRPKSFLLENVSNLIYIDNGLSFQTIRKSFEDIGYCVHWRIYNSRVVLPQQRNRLYIVGFRNDLQINNFKWPSLPVLKVCVRDILEDDLDDSDEQKLSEHQWSKICSSEAYQRDPTMRLARLDGGARTLLSNYKNGYAIKSEFVQTNSLLRPRFYSIRECARLQGFPESFKLKNSLKNENRYYYQLGNAVCPVVVATIASAILNHLKILTTETTTTPTTMTTTMTTRLPSPSPSLATTATAIIATARSCSPPPPTTTATTIAAATTTTTPPPTSSTTAITTAPTTAPTATLPPPTTTTTPTPTPTPPTTTSSHVVNGAIVKAALQLLDPAMYRHSYAATIGHQIESFVANELHAPKPYNGYGPTLSNHDVKILENLLSDVHEEEACICALQALGRLMYPEGQDGEQHAKICDVVIYSRLPTMIVNALTSMHAELRRLAVVVLNNMLDNPLMVDTTKAALKRNKINALLSTTLAEIESGDSREYEQLQKLIFHLK